MGPNVLLTIGALLILSILVNSSTSLTTSNTQIAEQNEYYICALSVAQSVIDEAKGKDFDQKTVGRTTSLSVSDSLSTVLGTDNVTEQSVPALDTLVTSAPYSASSPGFLSSVKFNDVDDYNGYKRKVNTSRTEGYTLTSRVSYASPAYPDSTKAVKTFCKRLTVSVKSPYMPDSLTLSYAFLY